MFVKFLRAGRYAREDVCAPQFEVEVGDVVEVTESHANDLVAADAAEITDGPESPKENDSELDGDEASTAKDGTSDEKSAGQRLKEKNNKGKGKKGK